MRPDTVTLWLSFIVAIICCVVVYVWTWALCRAAASPTPKPRNITFCSEHGFVTENPCACVRRDPRKQIGEALIARGDPIAQQYANRIEPPCPDCQYGEPCEKCLGVVQ
jgi:hypothetical protein